MSTLRHKHLHRRDVHHIANGELHALNIDKPPPAMDNLEQIAGLPVPEPNHVEIRSDSTDTSSASSATSTSCSDNDHSAFCEKPLSTSSYSLPIILGVTLPILASFILFFYLHRRHVRKQREEDANDRTNTMDFGLDHVPGLPGKRQFVEPMDEVDSKEKGRSGRPRQMSLDLDMVRSPYLLPVAVQNSRESLHSLSRTIHQNEDPYRPITHYLDDSKSIRSYSKNRNDGSSILTGHTGSSGAPSRLQDLSQTDLLSDAARFARSNPPTPGFVPPPRYNSLPLNDQSSNPSPMESPIDPGDRTNPFDDEKMVLDNKTGGLPKFPQPSARRLSPSPSRSQAPSTPQPPQPAELRNSYNGDNNAGPQDRSSNNYPTVLIHDSAPSPEPIEVPRPALLQNGNRKMAPNSLKALPGSSGPSPPHVAMPSAPDNDDYDGFEVTPPSPGSEEGRRGRRYSMEFPPEEPSKAGLGAPGVNPNRLSMGIRPLPPKAGGLDVEDPEMRANRIRSFYKEYFDDSKPEPQGQYDYPDAEDEENYLGDMAYYDPDSNNFVMPYAEPVTRRAMTPPPRAPPRFRGPAGARPRMGSMGALPSPGPRGQHPPSQMRAGPRAPVKKMPPPMDLSTLPTPAKLRDDSFALHNAHEFAPPTSFRDRQMGRSESPLGERRPYSPSVRPHTPLASAFEDLPAMPSPHLLRKSSTFTGLDFAPPRRMRDPDNMSDAGSIRSARSGISAVQQNAVRAGAYRVSRLEPGMVGTKDDMMESLRPKFDISRV